MAEASDKIAHHKLLYWLAWATEFIAIAINLAMLWATMHRSFTLGELDVLLIATSPFLLVACAEAAKIPFALTMVETRWALRPLFLVALVVVSAITFTNMVRGFEENFTYQVAPITQIEKKITGLEQQLATAETNTGSASETHQAQLAQLAADRDQLHARRQQLDKEKSDIKEQRLAIDATATEQTKSLENRLKMLLDHDRPGIANSKKLLDAIRDEADGKRKLLDAQDQALNAELADIVAQERELAARAKILIAPVATTIDPARLREQVTEEHTRKAEVAQQSQIYRLAAYWYGRDVRDVSRDQAGSVVEFYFAGLALLAALVGPVLAIASRLKPRPIATVKFGFVRSFLTERLVNTARRWMLSRRKKARITKVVQVEVPVDREVVKEVVREVPVDKIVIKEVVKEVPVDKIVKVEVVKEVIRREIMPIPILPEMHRELDDIVGKMRRKSDTDNSVTPSRRSNPDGTNPATQPAGRSRAQLRCVEQDHRHVRDGDQSPRPPGSNEDILPFGPFGLGHDICDRAGRDHDPARSAQERTGASRQRALRGEAGSGLARADRGGEIPRNCKENDAAQSNPDTDHYQLRPFHRASARRYCRGHHRQPIRQAIG